MTTQIDFNRGREPPEIESLPWRTKNAVSARLFSAAML